jgi:hypothetical protein
VESRTPQTAAQNGRQTAEDQTEVSRLSQIAQLSTDSSETGSSNSISASASSTILEHATSSGRHTQAVEPS